jgi:hypothetical protein
LLPYFLFLFAQSAVGCRFVIHQTPALLLYGKRYYSYVYSRVPTKIYVSFSAKGMTVTTSSTDEKWMRRGAGEQDFGLDLDGEFFTYYILLPYYRTSSTRTIIAEYKQYRKNNLNWSWPWPMSEERKKRETTAVNHPFATTDTTPLLKKQLYTSASEAGDINNEPHLGLLILESYGTSVPTVNPDKLLFEYTDNLVSFFIFIFISVEVFVYVDTHSSKFWNHM